MQKYIDGTIKTSEDTSLEKYIPLTLLKGVERVTKGIMCER